MDAIKFTNEAKRMCKSFGDDCTGCPAFDNSLTLCKLCIYCECSEEEKVSIVEKWSKEHPAKTRQSAFLERYPNASIDSQGVLYVCPAVVYGDNVCPKDEGDDHIICFDCRREFWMQEAE